MSKYIRVPKLNQKRRLNSWSYQTLRAVLNDPKFSRKFQNFENFVKRKEAFFQIISETPEATEGPEIWNPCFHFFSDFKICVAPENKGDIRASYAVPQVALNSRGSLDIGWDMTVHRKRGAPSGLVPSSRPRQRSRPSSDREEILHRMKAAAVIVLVLSTLVTLVVVHRLLRPILERNEYYVSEKRERESRSHVEFCICFLWYSSTYTLSAMKRYVTIFKRKIRNVVSHIQSIGCQLEKNYFTRWPIPLVVC